MAKIIVVCSYADSLVQLRRELVAQFAIANEVIACAPNASETLIAELDNLGVKFQAIKLWRTGLNPVKDFYTLWLLYKFFKKTKPDIILMYTSKPVIFGSIAAKLAGVKQCFSMITGLGSYFIHKDLKSICIKHIMILLYKQALKFNERIFFQNPDDISEFSQRNIFTELSQVVMLNGSGVNIEQFVPTPQPQDKVTFLLIARLIRDKGVCEYVAAAKIIKQQYPATQFYVAGWFEDKAKAINKELMLQWQREGTIKYLGKLGDVKPAIAAASVYVLPSYREGTPKTVLEAMACGRAIITTDVPGCRETVIPGENGFLVPPRDSKALADSMEKIILQPDLVQSMGQKSRKLAEQKYDVVKVNNCILETMGLSNAKNI